MKLKNKDYLTIKEVTRFINRSKRQVNRLIKTNKITKVDNMISMSSLIKYKELQTKGLFDLIYIVENTLFNRVQIRMFARSGLLGHKVFIFGDEIFVTKTIFNKLKHRSSQFTLFESIDVALFLDIPMESLKKAHRLNLFKGYVINERKIRYIYYTKRLINKIRKGKAYIPEITAFRISHYDKKYNIGSALRLMIKNNEIDYIKTNLGFYILESSVNNNLKKIKRSIFSNKKKVQLINENFKNQIKNRFVLKASNKNYLIYDINGVKYLENARTVKGKIVIQLNKDPIKSKIDYSMVKISKDNLNILNMYDENSLSYLETRMNIKSENHLLLSITDKINMNRFEILGNQTIYISGKYNSILGIPNSFKAFKIYKPINGIINNQNNFYFTAAQLLPILIIYRSFKKRSFTSFTIHYNYNMKTIKFTLDEYIYIIDYNSNLKRINKINDNLNFLFLQLNKKMKKILRSSKIEVNQKSIDDGYNIKTRMTSDLAVINNKNKNNPPIMLVYTTDTNRFQLTYTALNKKMLNRGLKIIPYNILIAIVNKKSYDLRSAKEFSKKLNENKEIFLYLNNDNLTAIESNDIFLIYSFNSLESKNSKSVNFNFDLNDFKKSINKLITPSY